jgi:hypothetical protein
MTKDDYLRRFRPDPRVLPGDAILTSADLEGLCKPDEELRRHIEEERRHIEEGRATVNAVSPIPHDWHRKGINACQVLYARLIAGIIPPDEIEATKRVILNLIEVGGWPGHLHDLKLIRLAIQGCGFVPGKPLKFSREQDHAARETA